MSKRSFVSRRHKSRGDPRSRTGLQCGQFIVLEASQRPEIKYYIYILRSTVAKTRCTLLEYGQSKVKGRNESQTSTTEAE